VFTEELVKRDVIVWPTTRDDKTKTHVTEIKSVHTARSFFSSLVCLSVVNIP
jgi:hypothetical protein